MKNLILILSMVLFVANSFAQNIVQRNDLYTAIKQCKVISKHDVQTSLNSDNPTALLNNQYGLVATEVESYLDNILSKYQDFSKKNSENMRERKFNLCLSNKEIKNLVSEYLSLYREYLLEEKNSDLKNLYLDKITREILKQFYIETLTEGVSLYTNKWLSDEEKVEYVPFLKTQTIHVKIADSTMMRNMASEYILDRKESIKKTITILSEIHSIIKDYGVGSVKIENENKERFGYIAQLINIFNKTISGGINGVKQNDINELPSKIIDDIKKHISNSSQLR